jgi:hypothetical protein
MLTGRCDCGRSALKVFAFLVVRDGENVHEEY